MRSKSLVISAVLFAIAATGSAKVRIQIVNGKRVIYNDGIGEKTAAVGKRSAGREQWLAARISRPSQFDPLINRAANDHSLDPRLVKSVMLVESGFNPAAVSPKGARGLMQLMPGTASRHGARNVHDPAQNIAAGTRYLSHLLGLEVVAEGIETELQEAVALESGCDFLQGHRYGLPMPASRLVAFMTERLRDAA